MGPLGWQETVVIFVLALLLFGPKKLPELGKTIGKALTEFRRASNELKSTFDREMQNLEKETESIKQATNEVQTELNKSVHDSSSYDYNYYDSNYDGYQPYESASSSESTASASAIQGADSNTPDGTAETATTANGSASAHVGVEGTVPVGSESAASAKPAGSESAPSGAEPAKQSA